MSSPVGFIDIHGKYRMVCLHPFVLSLIKNPPTFDGGHYAFRSIVTIKCDGVWKCPLINRTWLASKFLLQGVIKLAIVDAESALRVITRVCKCTVLYRLNSLLLEMFDFYTFR